MSRILLVDDDDYFRTMLRITLQKMGYEVLEAHNGKHALEKYEETTPDVVITDIVMPEQEGLETIRELRRKYPTVKIIAISGGGRVDAGDYLKIARAMGANLSLTKPFSNDELRAGLNELLVQNIS